jgi:hypothetical protein
MSIYYWFYGNMIFPVTVYENIIKGSISVILSSYGEVDYCDIVFGI